MDIFNVKNGYLSKTILFLENVPTQMNFKKLLKDFTSPRVLKKSNQINNWQNTITKPIYQPTAKII